MLLEFYERKKGRWLLPGETVSWEAWQVKAKVARISSEEGELPNHSPGTSVMVVLYTYCEVMCAHHQCYYAPVNYGQNV